MDVSRLSFPSFPGGDSGSGFEETADRKLANGTELNEIIKVVSMRCIIQIDSRRAKYHVK